MPLKINSVRLAVIWIDWYSYHVARFRALSSSRFLSGKVAGIELVGGEGVHRGLVFRTDERNGLAVSTLLPDASWTNARQLELAVLVWHKLDHLNPEAVLIPGYYTLPALAAAFWSKLHGRKAVLMTESTREDHARAGWKEAVKRLLVSTLFDAAITGGKRHLSYARSLGFRDDQLALFYDVVDNSYFEQQAAERRQIGRDPEMGLPGRYFLYVGRLAPEKNLETLIRSFKRFRDQGGQWSLVMVGDGPLSDRLHEQIEQAGLSNTVYFTGLKTTHELAPYYAFANCFVLPSWREPWGLVVNEAMASGLPVIVSSQCGCADDLVQDGRNGFRFDAGNEVELSDCMLRLERSDENQQQCMARASQELIAHYSLEHWAEEVARVIVTHEPISGRSAA